MTSVRFVIAVKLILLVSSRRYSTQRSYLFAFWRLKPHGAKAFFSSSSNDSGVLNIPPVQLFCSPRYKIYIGNHINDYSISLKGLYDNNEFFILYICGFNDVYILIVCRISCMRYGRCFDNRYIGDKYATIPQKRKIIDFGEQA